MDVSAVCETLVPADELLEESYKLLLSEFTFLSEYFLKIAILAILGDNVTIIRSLIRVNVLE